LVRAIGQGEADPVPGGRPRVDDEPAQASHQRNEIVQQGIAPDPVQDALAPSKVELMKRPALRLCAGVDLAQNEAEQGADRFRRRLEVRLDVLGDFVRLVEWRCARRGEVAELQLDEGRDRVLSCAHAWLTPSWIPATALGNRMPATEPG
jgi:hypothetical protein